MKIKIRLIIFIVKKNKAKKSDLHGIKTWINSYP